MKNIVYTIAIMAAFCSAFTGCKKEEPIAYQNDPAVYFDYVLYQNSSKYDSVTISFLDMPQESEYTVSVRVLIQGMIDMENDRTFVVRQIKKAPQDQNYIMAVSGEDFDPLNETQMVVSAGSHYGILPVVIKKTDHLGEEQVELQLELVDSDHFRIGMPHRRIFKIKYSNLPEQPGNWGSWQRVFGRSWGPVKHLFILSVVGSINWAKVADVGTQQYWRNMVLNALQKYNNEHQGNELREKDGTLVDFAI